MTKFITQISQVTYLLIISILVSAIFFGTAFAQQERNVGGSPVADQDRYKTQDQDQDRTNQPEEVGSSTVPAMEQEQIQIMNQNREQIQVPATGQQTGTQTQSGQGLNIDDPLQTQNREQVRVQTPSALQQYIQERTQAQVQQSEGETTETEQMRNQAMVAVQAVRAAEEMLGPNGPQLSRAAIEVDDTTQVMLQREVALQERSWLRNFFFGQDKETAQTIKQDAEQNRVRIQEMNRLLVDCGDCDLAVRTMLQEQLQTMLQEQDRLNAVAEEAMNRNGIFGWLFGN